MPTDVIMPQMGESIFEGTLTKWLKKPGDKVTRDEPLFEISTDKVDAEIPAPASGVLKEVKVSEGTTVQVNTVVGIIDAEGAAAAKAAPAPEKPAASQAKPAQRAAEPAKVAVQTKGGAAATDGSSIEKPAQPTAAAKNQSAPASSAASSAGGCPGGGGGGGAWGAAGGGEGGAKRGVLMPQRGESFFEGSLPKWQKRPGERAPRAEPLFE